MKLPSEFEARTLEWMGEETYRALEAALQTEPPVSIRVNRTKWSGCLLYTSPSPRDCS